MSKSGLVVVSQESVSARQSSVFRRLLDKTSGKGTMV